MEEDNEGALKRQYNNGQHQDSQDDTLTLSSKRFKLKTDATEDNLQSQEPLENNGNDNGNSNAVNSLAHNGDLTLSITNGQASLTSRNQQDNTEKEHHNETQPQPQPPASSSSPFALHPILDELTNKPIYPSYEPPGMRMSMSAILTETGKGYHDRSSSHSNNPDPGTIASSSSLTPSSTLPNSVIAQPSASRGQSLPPVIHFPHHHHHPSSVSERPARHTGSPSTEPSSQYHQQHHHRTSSHPNITSTLAQSPPTDEPVRKAEVSSLDTQQQRQSITNEQLVRALTTSIPMASDHSTQQQTVQTIDQQSQPTPVTADMPTPATAPPLALPSVSEVKQVESVPATLPSSSTTADAYNSTLSPSQPDFGAALRRLSGATGFDHHHSSGKIEDVSPSEILGSALAAVARSQHHGTTAAAAAIGNLAAITANISHILNSNNNNNSDAANNSSSPQSSSSPARVTASTGINTAIVVPSLASTTTSSQDQQDQKKDGNDSKTGSDDGRKSTTSQPLHPGVLTTMLDQAIQLGRTQQYQLQQDESSVGTRADVIVNQETVDGMKRAAEAAASAAAAVAASVSTSTTSPPPPTTATATTTSPSTSSPVRLLNHNHLQHHHQRHPHHQQPSPSHYNPPSLLPPNQQQQHHPHHYHHQHPYQTPLHYGQMMYSASTGPATSSLHAASPIYPPHPPSTVQAPKVVVNNEQVWKVMKGKKETNLGFYLYRPSMLLPNLQEHLNGIVQVRIPARYLSYQNPKVKKRAVWGTGIYTDDSDVVTMAIHSGKFIPAHHDPELESNDPFLLAVAGKNMDYIRATTRKQAISAKTYLLGRHKDNTVPDYDINVTLRVLPKLQDYTSTIQHRIKSRHWGGNHDGVSFFVEKVEQLKKGEARPCGRSSLKSNLFRYESYRKQAPKLMTGTDKDVLPNNLVYTP